MPGTSQTLAERLFDPWAAVVWAVAGAVATHLWRRYRKRMVVLRWEANHQSVAVSAADARFGTIEVLYNGNQVHNVFVSTVQIENESTTDLSDVTLDLVFQDGSTIYIAQGSLLGSANMIPFSDAFSAALAEAIKPDHENPELQQQLLHSLSRRRSFRLPVLNRGAVAKVELLVQAPPGTTPFIGVGCDHVGTKLVQKVPRQLLLGVNRRIAVPVGLVGAGAAALALPNVLKEPFVVAALAFLLGGFVAAIGAIAIRAYRFVARLLG